MISQNLDYDIRYTEYQLRRGLFRKLIRRLYLKNILKYVKGRAIDFGCGIGELLSLLPEGSIGLEINKASVEYCLKRGMNVSLYEMDLDHYTFKNIKPNYYQSFIMNHVLEHIDNPANVFAKILTACNRLGIERVILVVPGEKGYKFDRTHRTFIDVDFLRSHGLLDKEGYLLKEHRYFPINKKWPGKIFTHHELVVIYGRKND